MKIPLPKSRKTELLNILFIMLFATQSSLGISIIYTECGVMNPTHPQIQTSGGNQAHLINLVTPLDETNTEVNADILLADDSPLVLTLQREEADSDIIELILALVLDDEVCRMEVSLQRAEGITPTFAMIGAAYPYGIPVRPSFSETLIHYDEPVGITNDVYYGNILPSGVIPSNDPWLIDISSLDTGDTFDFVLSTRISADPPGHLNNYSLFIDCFDSPDPSDWCYLIYDLNADGQIDLHDFASFQYIFTRLDDFNSCGGQNDD